MESLITTERLGAVMRIRIDREAKKNALTIAMYDRMADAVEQAADNSEIRAILLTGGSKIFTAGNDLNDFLDPKRDGKGVQRFLSALPAIDKPVVAAVNGHAIGIGTTMLLHCDLVYVGRSASLRMPFVELGLAPEFGSSRLLPQLVGMQRASSLLLLGEAMSGEDAVRFGLATEVLDDDKVQARALEQAQRFSDLPPSAVRSTKALLRSDVRGALEDAMQREGTVFGAALRSDEAKEAMTAVLEKRPPDFSRF